MQRWFAYIPFNVQTTYTMQRSFTYICSTFNGRIQCSVHSHTFFQHLMNVSNATFICVHFCQRWINVSEWTLIQIPSYQRWIHVPKATFIHVHCVNVCWTYPMQRSFTYICSTFNERIQCNVHSHTFLSTLNKCIQCNVH